MKNDHPIRAEREIGRRSDNKKLKPSRRATRRLRSRCQETLCYLGSSGRGPLSNVRHTHCFDNDVQVVFAMHGTILYVN